MKNMVEIKNASKTDKLIIHLTEINCTNVRKREAGPLTTVYLTDADCKYSRVRFEFVPAKGKRRKK